MIFSLNSAGVRVFFAHFFEEEFCDGRGRGCRSLCGEHATASFWREPLLGGSHAPAGGTPQLGAGRVSWGFFVRGVCVLGMALVCSLLICSSGRGGLAGHWLGVPRGAVHWLGVLRAGGPLARCFAGRRSTQARPRFGGVAKKG